MQANLSASQNSNTRVVQYEGFIFAPATDEYAFRVEHPDDMSFS